MKKAMKAKHIMDTITSSSPKAGDGATAPKEEQTPPDGGSYQALRGEMDSFWHEINTMQRENKYIDTTIAGHWLQRAEQALQQQPPRISSARYYLLNGRFWLSRAEECSTTCKWGAIAIAIELVYLILMAIGIYYSNESLRTLGSNWLMIVPFHVVAWGFLGGVAWCMYSAAFWATRRLFDKNYLVYYIAHPWVSAVLGSAVSLLFFAGLAGLTSTAPGNDAFAFNATISVVSFVSGFSAKYSWQTLDRAIRKLFGESGGEKSAVTKASDELLLHAKVEK
jgi:hypothetical protein